MKLPKSVLRPVKTVHGGVHLDHNKNTEDFETVEMPTPERVYLPMLQHIGVPADVRVEKGQQVYVGTLLGESTPTVCSPVHSSVSGVVEDIKTGVVGGRPTPVVVIKSDGQMTPDPELKSREVNNLEQLISAVKACGLVGLGGAGFPTHIKLLPPKECKIDTLIINGAECEPYITSDYRECMEEAEDIIEGVALVKRVLKIKNAVIGIESNKPKAIEKMSALVDAREDFNGEVKVMKLPSRYPQGAEKVLIYSATGRKLPGGALPSDVGCIVMNITSVANLYRYVRTGMPLVKKRLTIDGTAVSEPKNVYIPLGTPIKDVLEFVGGIDENACRILAGGPMMGNAVINTDTVVEKRNNALLIMKENKKQVATNCIRCGRCIAACPMNLFPRDVEAALNADLKENLKELNVNYCIECGSCAYSCPAKRPLTEVMRIAKQQLRGMK